MDRWTFNQRHLNLVQLILVSVGSNLLENVFVYVRLMDNGQEKYLFVKVTSFKMINL